MDDKEEDETPDVTGFADQNESRTQTARDQANSGPSKSGSRPRARFCNGFHCLPRWFFRLRFADSGIPDKLGESAPIGGVTLLPEGDGLAWVAQDQILDSVRGRQMNMR